VRNFSGPARRQRGITARGRATTLAFKKPGDLGPNIGASKPFSPGKPVPHVGGHRLPGFPYDCSRGKESGIARCAGRSRPQFPDRFREGPAVGPGSMLCGEVRPKYSARRVMIGVSRSRPASTF